LCSTWASILPSATAESPQLLSLDPSRPLGTFSENWSETVTKQSVEEYATIVRFAWWAGVLG
jgi:hypothetical protein